MRGGYFNTATAAALRGLPSIERAIIDTYLERYPSLLLLPRSAPQVSRLAFIWRA